MIENITSFTFSSLDDINEKRFSNIYNLCAVTGNKSPVTIYSINHQHQYNNFVFILKLKPKNHPFKVFTAYLINNIILHKLLNL